MKRLFVVSEVSSPEDVRAHLADPARHWREGYSAYELANSWVTAGDFPSAVCAVLATSPVFQGAGLIEAFFERRVELPTPGRPSQPDIIAYARIPAGFAVIAVEGKVRETFGPYVFAKEETPGVQVRLKNLCELLGLAEADVLSIRYQLLHRTVSAILEAERYFAEDALMLVHSFDPVDSSFDDYRNFAVLMGFPREEVLPNRIVGYKQLGRVRVHIGWVRDVATVNRWTEAHSQQVVPPQVPTADTSVESSSNGCLISILIERIKQSKLGGRQKASSTISSNISLGFKKATGGKDYKLHYDDALRSGIASWGAEYGVPVSLIVDLVAAMKVAPRQEKLRVIDDISRELS